MAIATRRSKCYNYSNMKEIEQARVQLRARFDKLNDDDKRTILRAPELRDLFAMIGSIEPASKAQFGQNINKLKQDVAGWVDDYESAAESRQLKPIDITAPWDINTASDKRPASLPAAYGSQHPLTKEMQIISDIYLRMGFEVHQSREIDNEFNMFTSLNFPQDHPARDDYDTFVTKDGYIAPAHTSTMQHRIISGSRAKLEKGLPIAAIVPDRVFRNEDVDATHEHTFYQIEGIYVDKGANVGHLIATLKTYMSEYYGQELNVKIQPFYFPFTEPSFEFAIERPARLKKDDTEEQKWLELGGCGMIHPNVLKQAGVDPSIYTGFAWGFGIERMVMMKYSIEDIRHFMSGKLNFLRQF